MVNVPTIEFEEHKLENGLQVLVHKQDRVPLVHLSVHYRVGSSYEQPGLSGFAHLFEHMMFQGSENVGKNEHGSYIDNAGGRWNATTGKDRTNYYETVPSHYLELALWLEADRMRSLKVTQEGFDNQRQTVIEEKKQSYDNRPYGLATLRFEELAYENWSYAHPIIGAVEDLEKSTLEDAVNFHRTYYGPGNATLVLSGDLPDGNTLKQVQKYFGTIVNHTQPQSPRLEEPKQTVEKVETMKDPLAVLPAVYIGYHMPALGSPEYYALSVLALVLSHGESSRFYRQFIYDNNWITSLSVGPNQYKGPELFYIWFQVQNEVKVEQVLQAVDQELERLRESTITAEELEKAKNQIAYRFVGRLAKVSRIAELLAHYALFFEDTERINQDLDHYLCVSEADIQQAAQKVFGSENQTLIVVKPGTQKTADN
ncbi:insulinase family protein [Acidobacteria bacterium AH-259-D05]|nr:insulinase family protein [Acidobacteria bacterium AH-259-D05]